jgi:MarR family transcriptional regulator for hemolysin
MSRQCRSIDQFGWQLGQTARAWRAELDRRMAPLGLTDARGFTLLQLSRSDDPVTQKALAGLAGVQGPTLVRVVDWLEQEGLVSRTASPEDRRCKLLILTPQGREIAGRIERIAADVREELFEGLDHQAVEHSLELFHRLRERLADMKSGGMQ